jgi:hypothetical protein
LRFAALSSLDLSPARTRAGCAGVPAQNLCRLICWNPEAPCLFSREDEERAMEERPVSTLTYGLLGVTAIAVLSIALLGIILAGSPPDRILLTSAETVAVQNEQTPAHN